MRDGLTQGGQSPQFDDTGSGAPRAPAASADILTTPAARDLERVI
jgi:hypothetical protein